MHYTCFSLLVSLDNISFPLRLKNWIKHVVPLNCFFPDKKCRYLLLLAYQFTKKTESYILYLINCTYVLRIKTAILNLELRKIYGTVTKDFYY